MDLPRLTESWVARYGVAAVAVGLGVALRLALDPLLQDRSPFVTLYLAIIVAARWGGTGAGAFATVLGGLTSTWLFLAPRHSLALDRVPDQVGLVLYIVMGTACAIVAGGLRDTERRARGLEVSNLDIGRLKAAEEQLRESDRRKDEFLAMLAHELRNPLASIGYALSAQALAEPDAEAMARARAIAERQLHQLTRLVDDLLDVSRIVLGKITLRPERVELAQVVARAVETSRPLVDQRGHALTVALPVEPAWLDADIVRLSQAFSNLLNNAAKFTEPGGRVSLLTEEEGDSIVVRVLDSGIGIPAETLPRVFEMFAQGRRARGVEEGLGLGLSLVRRLVEKHGGTVAAASEGPGRGSTFTVRLPRASPPKGQTTPRPLRSTRAPGRRALVVDDNVDSAESLAMLLTLRGHDVRVAHGGEEALAVFRDHRPEVVLLDIGLPDIDGLEVARRMRKGGGAEGVLLVALTGWGQSEDRQRSKEAGFDRHLTKPVEPAVLESLFEIVPGPPDQA